MISFETMSTIATYIISKIFSESTFIEASFRLTKILQGPLQIVFSDSVFIITGVESEVKSSSKYYSDEREFPFAWQEIYRHRSYRLTRNLGRNMKKFFNPCPPKIVERLEVEKSKVKKKRKPGNPLISSVQRHERQ